MRNSKTKKMVLNALLIGIGALLHQLTPALGLPMQPDFALAMLFIVIILNDGDYKTSLVCGIVTGVFTALTTKFPGGQVPNMIDKVITVQVVVFMLYTMRKIKFLSKIDLFKRKLIEAIVILSVGTLVSGVVFITSASILVGLPAPFLALFTTVVLPAVLINSVAGVFLFKIVEKSLRLA
ncbi:tryptophan transporter [uncultured Clostridium sp.]|uniref:tryptophan transporter n=1 Tax=uncultured Clostridium sp. TaxID=59620 RepID=UPI002630B2E2|nr:tryptophan transporter [uncultured Clostridium sp.]